MKLSRKVVCDEYGEQSTIFSLSTKLVSVSVEKSDGFLNVDVYTKLYGFSVMGGSERLFALNKGHVCVYTKSL